MSFLPWFSSVSSKDFKAVSTETESPDSKSAAISFDNIVGRFDEMNQEISKLRDQLATYNDTIDKLRQDVRSLQAQHQRDEATISSLRSANKQDKEDLSSLQMAVAGTNQAKEIKKQGNKAFVKHLNKERQKQRTELARVTRSQTDLEARKNILEKELTATRLKVEAEKRTNVELKLDLEYLKCTTPSAAISVDDQGETTGDHSMPLAEVPFILVLIDGDAYAFTNDGPHLLEAEEATRWATQIVRGIKNYLQLYIIQHKLPPHCKLIVRVLKNALNSKMSTRWGLGLVERKGRQMTMSEAFMVAFNESAPLFDFIDAGQGKERVDGKIHELYHTFISNPSCHKIFLATATDNGFARMLEQYVDHPVARAKTCMITPGFSAEEIAELDLETIEWPLVFKTKHPPLNTTKRRALRQAQQDLEEARHRGERDRKIKEVGVVGYEEFVKQRAIARVTRGLTGSKGTLTLAREICAMRDRRVRGMAGNIPNGVVVDVDDDNAIDEDSSPVTYHADDGID